MSPNVMGRFGNFLKGKLLSIARKKYDKPGYIRLRPIVSSAYQKNNFLISQPKHMLWVLKRTVSMRRFF